MAETRMIDYAISLLDRCEAKLSNVARNSDDYRFLASLRSTSRAAQKELEAIHNAPPRPVILDYDTPEPEQTSCHCNADNAPCNWCETHCADCNENVDDCACS